MMTTDSEIEAAMELMCDCENPCVCGDTVDRVPRVKNESLKSIPMGTLKKPRLERSQREDNLTLLTGGFEDEDERSERKMKTLIKMIGITKITEKQEEYLTAAKLQSISADSIQKYFSNKFLVYRWGVTSYFRCRLGFCDFSQTWKVYLYRPNMNFLSSVIPIPFVELHLFIALLEKFLKKIQEGIESKDLYLKRKVKVTGTEGEKKTKFWEGDGIEILESGLVRVKVAHEFGLNYSIYMNTPRSSDQFENYSGPKIKMSIQETEQFIEVLRDLMSNCPSYSEMLDYVDLN